MDEERAQLEREFLRAQRRGELTEAVRLLRDLMARYPDDASLADRLGILQETLQPMELMGGKERPSEVSGPANLSSPEAEGERLFALGDYGGAARAYRRAVGLRPDSELLRERLYDLVELAKGSPDRSPTDQPLPRDAARLLEALMDRIASRRRL